MEPNFKCAACRGAALALLAAAVLLQAGQHAPARAACSPWLVTCDPDYPPQKPPPKPAHSSSSTQPAQTKGKIK